MMRTTRRLGPKEVGAPLAVAVLAALLMLAPQSLAGGGFTGTMTVKPRVLKKGQKTTATANTCRSGVYNGRRYTASVEFLFEPPSRPVYAPHYTVRTSAAGKASKTKRLRAVGTWEVVARCLNTFSKSRVEVNGVYEPMLVHVLRRH